MGTEEYCTAQPPAVDDDDDDDDAKILLKYPRKLFYLFLSVRLVG